MGSGSRFFTNYCSRCPFVTCVASGSPIQPAGTPLSTRPHLPYSRLVATHRVLLRRYQGTTSPRWAWK